MTTIEISDLIRQAKNHVGQLFKERKRKEFLYHNLSHTKSVVNEAKKIAKQSKLSEDEYAVLVLSAWFHDVGYLVNPKDHEKTSAKEAADFLSSRKIDNELIAGIKKTIAATAIPQRPQTTIEKILCDADLSYLGKRKFKSGNKKLLNERNLLGPTSTTKIEWRVQTIEFLENHSYFTNYANARYAKRKENHLKKLRKELAKQSDH